MKKDMERLYEKEKQPAKGSLMKKIIPYSTLVFVIFFYSTLVAQCNFDSVISEARYWPLMSPEDIDLLTDLVAVVEEGGHYLALRSDSTVWCWGSGIVGDGKDRVVPGEIYEPCEPSEDMPTQVVGRWSEGYLTDIIVISTGSLGDGAIAEMCMYFNVALCSDGTVWTWGDNSFGQLGWGWTGDKYSAVKVSGPDGKGDLSDVVAISAGLAYAVALRSDGTVWAWGLNEYGQLGNGEYGHVNPEFRGAKFSIIPVQVLGPNGKGFLTGVTAVAAGSGHAGHTVAVKSDGTVWAWGSNSYGELGNGKIGGEFLKFDEGIDQPVPVQVMGAEGKGFLRDVVKVYAGWGYTLAQKSDLSIWAWGEITWGEHNTIDYGSTPVKICP